MRTSFWYRILSTTTDLMMRILIPLWSMLQNLPLIREIRRWWHFRIRDLPTPTQMKTITTPRAFEVLTWCLKIGGQPTLTIVGDVVPFNIRVTNQGGNGCQLHSDNRLPSVWIFFQCGHQPQAGHRVAIWSGINRLQTLVTGRVIQCLYN